LTCNTFDKEAPETAEMEKRGSAVDDEVDVMDMRLRRL
jgi:hypothetical protein